MNLKRSDFPGMACVCLRHAGDYFRDGSLKWREGGTADCMCERATDALVRLRAEAAWARQDEAKARERAELLEAEVARLQGRSAIMPAKRPGGA